MLRCWALLGSLLLSVQVQACALADDLVRRYGISAAGFEQEIAADEVQFEVGDDRVVQVPLNGRDDILDGFNHLAFVHTLSKQAWILRTGGLAGVYEWYGPVKVDLKLLAGCAGAQPALAAESVAPVMCGPVQPSVEQQQLRLGRIQAAAGERVHFYRWWDGCPAHRPECEQKSYLVAGDTVVISHSKEDWTCVGYQGRTTESVAWVLSRNVAVLPTPVVATAEAWLGRWVAHPQRIQISRGKDGQLYMDSYLRWDGGRSMAGEPYSNFGGMQALLHIDGNRAKAADDFCKVEMTLLGSKLIVNDNSGCGGQNVRHTGIYGRP